MSIIIILVMLVLNALLAAYEMALASVSRTKLSILAQEKKYGAESALYMKDHMEGSLATIQIGITLVGAGAAAVGGAGADEWFAPWLQANFHLPLRLANALAVILVVLPLSFITIVFGELTPKTFALKNKEWVTLKFSPCMRHLYRFLYPIVRIMEAIVAMLTKKTVRKNIDPKEAQKAAMADLRAAVSIASSSRLFGKAEEKIVLASASFCTRKIKEIQVPLDQVYMLYAGDTIADTFIKAHLDMHTRFPVYEKLEDPQSIIGYLNFKDIFSATKTAAQGVTPTTRSILRPILRLDEDTIISAALEKMMKDHQHICLVTDDDKITGMGPAIPEVHGKSPAQVAVFGEHIGGGGEDAIHRNQPAGGVDGQSDGEPQFRQRLGGNVGNGDISLPQKVDGDSLIQQNRGHNGTVHHTEGIGGNPGGHPVGPGLDGEILVHMIEQGGRVDFPPQRHKKRKILQLLNRGYAEAAATAKPGGNSRQRETRRAAQLSPQDSQQKSGRSRFGLAGAVQRDAKAAHLQLYGAGVAIGLRIAAAQSAGQSKLSRRNIHREPLQRGAQVQRRQVTGEGHLVQRQGETVGNQGG